MKRISLNRRVFLKSCGLTSLSMTFLKNFLFADDRKNSLSKPNVLFIAIDDLNDWTGCLAGHPDAKTPHLDSLAKKSVLFTNAHCAAPACNPSRAALMTGIRPSSSGVYRNSNPWRHSPVLQNAVTLPQHFMAHGYKAMGSGKIYHGRFPDPASWDEYWPSKTKAMPESPYPRADKRPLNGIPETGHFDWGPLQVNKEEMGDWKVADWIINQLQSDQNKPFFLACGFFRPHLPWYVPQKYFDMFPLEKVTLPNVNKNDLDDVPPAGRKMARPQRDHKRVLKYNQWRKAVQAYLASIRFVDDCVGRVINALENSSYKDNTVIVLWSDHGWHLGEKLHWRKFALWEEATHNMLLIKAPGVTSSDQKCNQPVNLLDIYPTLIDLCLLKPREELQGNSLLPLLKNPDKKWEYPSLTTHGK